MVFDDMCVPPFAGNASNVVMPALLDAFEGQTLCGHADHVLCCGQERDPPWLRVREMIRPRFVLSDRETGKFVQFRSPRSARQQKAFF